MDFNSVLLIKKCAEGFELWFSCSERHLNPKLTYFGKEFVTVLWSNFAWRHEVGPLNLFFYETSWLGVEKTKTIQMIWQNTKHKCVHQIQKLVQYSSFLLAFYEHIFYVSSRYKETIRLYEVKEIWSVIGKILLHIGKNLSEVRR